MESALDLAVQNDDSDFLTSGEVTIDNIHKLSSAHEGSAGPSLRSAPI